MFFKVIVQENDNKYLKIMKLAICFFLYLHFACVWPELICEHFFSRCIIDINCVHINLPSLCLFLALS